MKQVVAVAGGDVQAVGYREFVRKAAYKKPITGYVKNLDTGEVEIVAEGEEDELKIFLTSIQVSNYPIDVIEFSVSWKEATGEFRRFEIIRGNRDDELFERVDMAGALLYQVAENTSLSLIKQDQMLEKQDRMLEKQDQVLHNQDQMLIKQEQGLELQHETIQEIRGLRKDSANYLEAEFSHIKQKLQKIEDALSREGIAV